MLLLGRNRAGACGVDIPNHYDPIRLFSFDHFFKFDHGSADLFGVTAGTDIEVNIRLGNLKIREK